MPARRCRRRGATTEGRLGRAAFDLECHTETDCHAEVMSCAAIAKVLYLDDDTIRYWYQLYGEKGLTWLADFGYKGRACELTAAQQDALQDWVSQTLPRTTTTVGEWIEKSYGVSYTRWGLRYPSSSREMLPHKIAFPLSIRTVAPDMLRLAEHILDSKAATFDPSIFRDRYEEALLAHLKAKQAGAVQEPKPTFAVPRRVINLMEALRRSIAADKKRPPAPRKGAPAVPSRKRA
jgi:transposase